MMRLVTNALLKHLPKEFTNICEITFDSSFKIGHTLQDMGYNVICLNVLDNKNNIRFVNDRNIDCIVSILVGSGVNAYDVFNYLYRLRKPLALLLNANSMYETELFEICNNYNPTIVLLDPNIEIFLDINRRYRQLAWLLYGFDSFGGFYFNSLKSIVR